MQCVGERIRWARLRWMKTQGLGKEFTGTDAAKRLGIPIPTYLGYENGDRRPGRANVMKIGDLYKVRWEWLLEGQGSPTRKNQETTIIGAGTSAAVALYAEPHVDVSVELPPGSGVNTVAVQVRGAGMRGISEDGVLFFFEHLKQPPTDELLGKLCVLELDDGTVVVRTLEKGSRKGRYILESATEAPMRDRRIKWAARVTWIKPK